MDPIGYVVAGSIISAGNRKGAVTGIMADLYARYCAGSGSLNFHQGDCQTELGIREICQPSGNAWP